MERSKSLKIRTSSFIANLPVISLYSSIDIKEDTKGATYISSILILRLHKVLKI